MVRAYTKTPTEKAAEASRVNGAKGGRPKGAIPREEIAARKAVALTLQERCQLNELRYIDALEEIAFDRKTAAAARTGAISLLLDRGRGKAIQPELHGGVVTLQVVTGVPEPDEDWPGQHSSDVPSAQLQPKTPYIQHDAEEARLSSPSSSIATAAVCEAATVGSPPIPPRPLPQAPPVTNTSQLPGDMTPAEHFMVAEQLKLKQARDADQDKALGLKLDWGR